MKKLLIVAILMIATPANAWYDGYGNYHCTYLDPFTSFFDSIFGQPCYVVVQAPPVVIEKPIYVDRPVAVPVPVPQPYAVPVPAPYPVPVY